MTTIKVSKTISATWPTGGFILESLRDYVEACKELPGTAKVAVSKYNGDIREPGSVSISVSS